MLNIGEGNLLDDSEKSKTPLLKSLPFWNIIITIILGVVGAYITINLQNRIASIEIENRAQTFRPKIELKSIPVVSRIIFTRDTSWIRPKVDIDKIHPENNPKAEVIMNLQANFSFTLINNSEHIADLSSMVFWGKNNEEIEPIFKLTDRKIIDRDIVQEGIVQLDSKDTFNVDFNNHLFNYLNDEDTVFYLHFVVFYKNQFQDLYETYFIFQGQIDQSPEFLFYSPPQVELIKLDRLVMKDNFIKMKLYSDFTYYLKEDESAMILESNEETFKKYDQQKAIKNKNLKQE